jgi:hypothetical protein
VPYVKGGPSADVMCVGVTGYYRQEFLKGVAQGEAGGSGTSADDANTHTFSESQHHTAFTADLYVPPNVSLFFSLYVLSFYCPVLMISVL